MTTTGAGASSALSSKQPSSSFDIVATYHHLLATNPTLTESVAAIEALIALVNTISSSTVHETTIILKRQSQLLKASVENSLALSAGTDLFLRYLVSSLKQQERDAHIPYESFEERLQRLLHSGRDFAARALQARETIAVTGARLVRDGSVVLTHGASRAVAALLVRAAQRYAGRSVRFRVVYVADELRPEENESFTNQLRAAGIPVASITGTAVAHVLGLSPRVDVVIIGAEVVTSNGGIISRLGTYQLAVLAKTAGIKFYVAAETHKFVKKNVSGQKDMSRGEMAIKQQVVDFTTDGTSRQTENGVDYTPETLITQLITENGMKQPSYVYGILLDTYGSLISDTTLDALQEAVNRGDFNI